MKKTSTALLALSLSSFGALVQAEPASQTFIPTGLSTKNAQAEANGFFEDQHLTGTTRNWYANELKRRDEVFRYNDNGIPEQTSRRINWQQGTIVNYSSGFTQGVVGFSTELRCTTPLRWTVTPMTSLATPTVPWPTATAMPLVSGAKWVWATSRLVFPTPS